MSSFRRIAGLGVVALALGVTAGCSSTGGEPAPEAAPAENVGVPMLPMQVVAANSLNVRAEPNKTGMILGTLKKGTEVRVVEESGAWKKVQSDGAAPEGWVLGEYLKAHGK